MAEQYKLEIEYLKEALAASEKEADRYPNLSAISPFFLKFVFESLHFMTSWTAFELQYLSYLQEKSCTLYPSPSTTGPVPVTPTTYHQSRTNMISRAQSSNPSIST